MDLGIAGRVALVTGAPKGLGLAVARTLERGSSAPGVRSALAGNLDSVPGSEIKGSMTIVELLKRFPDGRAARLMADLNWACAHCGGAFHEPLTMAAKRHARDPRAVLDAFRALDGGEPTSEQVEAARRMVD